VTGTTSTGERGPVEFSASAKQEFDALLGRYPTRQAALLPTLRLVEREFGAVSEEGMRYAATLLGLPPARVKGVATFYTHFRKPGDGKYVIHVCCTLPCALRGSASLVDALTRTLGIGVGETTRDGRFTLRKAECLAACDLAPVIAINDDLVGPLAPESLGDLLSKLP
jgi:NADH-quinone oxidoreductase E subunit